VELKVLSATCLHVLSPSKAQGMFFVYYYYTLQQARRALLVRNKLRELKISTKLIVH